MRSSKLTAQSKGVVSTGYFNVKRFIRRLFGKKLEKRKLWVVENNGCFGNITIETKSKYIVAIKDMVEDIKKVREKAEGNDKIELSNFEKQTLEANVCEVKRYIFGRIKIAKIAKIKELI